MRLDRALRADVRAALRSWPIRLFLALQLAAGALFVARRGAETVSTVLLVWLGMAIVAFFAWWAGRDRHARPEPDAVPGARARAVCALVAAAGMFVWGGGLPSAGGAPQRIDLPLGIGFVLLAVGIGGWLWAALRTGGREGLRSLPARLARDPRPFVPLLLLIALPKLIVAGPAFVVGAVAALPSGIGQELLFLIGLFAPLEAALGRSDMAGLAAALVFGLVHLPLVGPVNHGDLLAALSNVIIFQASVGLVACLAFVRHRAAVPIGVAHALAIA